MTDKENKYLNLFLFFFCFATLFLKVARFVFKIRIKNIYFKKYFWPILIWYCCTNVHCVEIQRKIVIDEQQIKKKINYRVNTKKKVVAFDLRVLYIIYKYVF